MSRVTFQSRNGEAELLGRERAYAGVMLTDFSLGLLGLDGYGMMDMLRKVVPERAHLSTYKPDYQQQGFRTYWSVVDEPMVVNGEKLYPFNLALNTAVVAGSDQIILLARMHATCEIFGYVEGPDRAWLADIIDTNFDLDLGILRDDMGWEAVSELLRADEDGPVVMSYSVTDGFPDPYRLLEVDDEKEGSDERMWDKWDKLTDDQRWDMGIQDLRQRGKGNVDLSPSQWGRNFGNGWNVFHLKQALYEREEELND